MSIYSEKNQLLFNLDVPAVHQNVAARFHRPGPLILDKAGIGPPGVLFGCPQGHTASGHEHAAVLNSSGMSFSYLSEDNLSNAVKLAQRDMKKKREQEIMQHGPKSAKPGQTEKRDVSPKFGRSRTRTKMVHGKEYWDRMKKQQEKSQQLLRVREVNKGFVTKNAKTQSPPRNKISRPGSASDPYFPVTSNSPPSKDTEFKLYPVKHAAPCEQPAKEIERLQREMEEYLQQIQVIEQRAINEQNVEFLHKHRGKKEGFLDKEEGRERKQTRSDELLTRTNRQLYVLRHQIREIQNELLRVGPDKIKHTKKSRTFAQLAQAHRGAVRAIQCFVTNLPNTDLSTGLPGTYHELALLIRQMSLISSQLATGENSSAQGDLMKMLDRVDELNKEWCKEMAEPAIEISLETKRRKSPPRPPFNNDPKVISKQPPQPRLFPRGKENKPKGLLHVKTQGVKKPVEQGVHHVDPERKEALRAGIAALVREGQMKRSQASMAWEIPSRAAPVMAEKSVILPKKLQEKRAKIQKTSQQPMADCHFADPTIAFALKSHSPPRNPIKPERSFSAPPTPSSEKKKRARSPSAEPWRPGGILKKSPSAKRRSRSYSPRGKKLNLLQNFLDGSTSDVAKTLFFEDSQIQSQNSTPCDRQSRSRIKKGLRPVEQREKQMKSKPMSSSEEYEKLLETMPSDYPGENDSYLQKGDRLTESILEDVLNDTAEEFERLELQEKSHRRALALQDNPTLQNLMQRLAEMEEEQVSIRKRWNTVHFAEVGPQTSQKRGVQPLAPTAFTITKHAGGPKKVQMNLHHEPCSADEPIIFTKSKPEIKFRQQGFPVEFNEPLCDRAYSTVAPAPTNVTIPQRELDSIFLNQDRFSRFLKKSSHHVSGRFNPWKLMEELADQILDECYNEIVSELEEINESVVNQICKVEFTVPPSPEAASPSTLYPMVDIFEVQPGQMPLSRTPSLQEDMEVKEIYDENYGKVKEELPRLSRQTSVEQGSVGHSQRSKANASDYNDDTYDDEFEEVTADDEDYDEEDLEEEETEEISEVTKDDSEAE